MHKTAYHKPVMAAESISLLNINPGGIYVDVTFGGGGHSALILENLNSTGRLIAMDRDADAMQNAPSDSRLTLVNHNYKYLRHFTTYLGIQQVDGILADLGISSHQIDTAERGFAHRLDGPLDMRMSRGLLRTAADLLNHASEEEIARILYVYGEVSYSRKMASAIVNTRKATPFKTISDLLTVIEPFNKGSRKSHFKSQVFQALRIEVNQELAGLEQLLEQGTQILKPGGRMVILSYHSLEDRMVKHYMKYGNFEGPTPLDLYGRSHAPLKPVSKGVLIPGEQEIADNPRARSAKLRAATKLTTEQ